MNTELGAIARESARYGFIGNGLKRHLILGARNVHRSRAALNLFVRYPANQRDAVLSHHEHA